MNGTMVVELKFSETLLEMIMRHISAVIGVLVLVGCLLIIGVAPAPAQEFKVGQHYFELPRPLKFQPDDKRIEVLMFFWYGCGGCYHLDKTMAEWEKALPEDVRLIRLPALFNKTWAHHGQIFLALQAMGVDHKVHQAVFEIIQQQHKKLMTEPEMKEFLAEQSLDADEFFKLYNSPEIKAQMEHVLELMAAYRFDSVPAIIVNGKYRFDFGSIGGSAEIVKVIDYLVQNERVAKSLGPKP